jgi:hypothetical protein
MTLNEIASGVENDVVVVVSSSMSSFIKVVKPPFIGCVVEYVITAMSPGYVQFARNQKEKIPPAYQRRPPAYHD